MKKKEDKWTERGPRPPGIDRGDSYDQFPTSFMKIRLQGAEFWDKNRNSDYVLVMLFILSLDLGHRMSSM